MEIVAVPWNQVARLVTWRFTSSPAPMRGASRLAPRSWTPRAPTELLDVVRRLTLLQIDPVAAVAPSADLVAWSRLGAAHYAPADWMPRWRTGRCSNCGR
jgi:hypothetical protein